MPGGNSTARPYNRKEKQEAKKRKKLFKRYMENEDSFREADIGEGDAFSGVNYVGAGEASQRRRDFGAKMDRAKAQGYMGGGKVKGYKGGGCVMPGRGGSYKGMK